MTINFLRLKAEVVFIFRQIACACATVKPTDLKIEAVVSLLSLLRFFSYAVLVACSLLSTLPNDDLVNNSQRLTENTSVITYTS